MSSEGKEIYASRVYEDLLLCAAASYFTAAFNYDFYISGAVFTAGRYLSLAVMVLCWLVMSFTNGIRMRKSFIIGAFLWNGALPLLSIITGSVRALKFSKAGLLIDEVSMILCEFPYYELEKLTGIKGLYVSVVLAVLCLPVFAAGYYYTKKFILNDIERN